MGDWQWGSDNGLWGADGMMNYSAELADIKRAEHLEDIMSRGHKVKWKNNAYEFVFFQDAAEFAKLKGNCVIKRSPNGYSYIAYFK